ncbi:AlpA family phage regulatory protein [Diaphorobacter sp.]|uniref:helix-turn-helix transcriptional regulator n=1 Tax=Diaphorobacter sp. TaxID=1934310 RepID=UPI0002DE16F3|nr:AlpA family phage regulatory protein [Diaphorobacter sp.]
MKLPEVLQRGKVSRSALLRWLDQPEIGFPQPVKIGRGIFWIDTQVDAWFSRQAESSAAATAAAQAQALAQAATAAARAQEVTPSRRGPGRPRKVAAAAQGGAA